MSNIACLFLPLAFSSLPAVLPFVSPSSQVVFVSLAERRGPPVAIFAVDFHHTTVYTTPRLYTPTAVYTTPRFTQTTIYTKPCFALTTVYTAPRFTPATAYTKPRFAPTTVYNKPRLRQTTVYNTKPILHQLPFTPSHRHRPPCTLSHVYTKHRLHQTTVYTNHRLHPTTVYTNRSLHETYACSTNKPWCQGWLV